MAGEPGAEKMPDPSAVDPFRACFGDMKGDYTVEDLWAVIQRDPHWFASFPGGVREFKKELQMRGIYDKDRKGRLKCRL